MDTLFENDRIVIDYIEDIDSYRVTTFDNNFHFDEEIIFDSEQFYFLKNALNNININNKEDL